MTEWKERIHAQNCYGAVAHEKNAVFHVTRNSSSRMKRIKGVPRDATRYFSAIREEFFEPYFNGEL